MLITQQTGTNSFTVTLGLDETKRKIIRLKNTPSVCLYLNDLKKHAKAMLAIHF